jgi:hypothetical protein
MNRFATQISWLCLAILFSSFKIDFSYASDEKLQACAVIDFLQTKQLSDIFTLPRIPEVALIGEFGGKKKCIFTAVVSPICGNKFRKRLANYSAVTGDVGLVTEDGDTVTELRQMRDYVTDSPSLTFEYVVSSSTDGGSQFESVRFRRSPALSGNIFRHVSDDNYVSTLRQIYEKTCRYSEMNDDEFAKNIAPILKAHRKSNCEALKGMMFSRDPQEKCE